MYAPVTAIVTRPFSAIRLRLASFTAATLGFLELLAAANRAARAVEARRDPTPEDLRALGIKDRLPPLW